MNSKNETLIKNNEFIIFKNDKIMNDLAQKT